MKGVGKIVPNGVSLEKHESDTIVYFTNLGKVVELIPPSNTPCNRRPDFVMDGLEWEMKSPHATNKIVIERAFHKALRQSCNVVMDLRRAKGEDEIAVAHLRKCFITSNKAKKLYIITKRHKLLDYFK